MLLGAAGGNDVHVRTCFLFGAYALFANIELRGVRGERLLGGKTRPPCNGELEFTCEIGSVNSLFFLVLALPKWRRRLLLLLFRLLLLFLLLLLLLMLCCCCCCCCCCCR